jgi:hypothetical protein
MKKSHLELQKECELKGLKRAGIKQDLVQRIILTDRTLKEKNILLNSVLNQKSKEIMNINEFYKENFNSIDIFAKSFHFKEPTDQINNWKTKFLWDILRIALTNAHAIMNQFEIISILEFRQIIGNYLMKF